MKISCKSIRSGRFLSGVILLVLLFAIGIPQAMACHKGKPHGKDAPEVCEDPPVPDTPDVWAVWGGGDASAVIQEDTERLCVVTQIAVDESSGTYVCEDTSLFFEHDFELMTSVCLQGKYQGFCEPSVNSLPLCPDAEYSFSWSGDCTMEPGCDVTIINRHSKYGNYLLHMIDRSTLVALAGISDSPTHNPFASEQVINVVAMHYTMFAAKGKDKVLAKCGLEPVAGSPVILKTWPDQEPG